MLCDARERCRQIARLAQPHHCASGDELSVVARDAGSECDGAPHKQADGDEPRSSEAVGRESRERTHDAVDPQEDRAQQSELYVGEAQVGLLSTVFLWVYGIMS